MSDWFDERFGDEEDEEYRKIPSVRDYLEVIRSGVEGRRGVKMPDARLDRIERLMGEDIGYLHRAEEFSPSLNTMILAEMFTLTIGGRKVEEKQLGRYEKALEKHNRNMGEGFLG